MHERLADVLAVLRGHGTQIGDATDDVEVGRCVPVDAVRGGEHPLGRDARATAAQGRAVPATRPDQGHDPGRRAHVDVAAADDLSHDRTVRRLGGRGRRRGKRGKGDRERDHTKPTSSHVPHSPLRRSARAVRPRCPEVRTRTRSGSMRRLRRSPFRALRPGGRASSRSLPGPGAFAWPRAHPAWSGSRPVRANRSRPARLRVRRGPCAPGRVTRRPRCRRRP